MTIATNYLPSSSAPLAERMGTVLYNYVKASNRWDFGSLAAALDLPKVSGQTLSLHLRGRNGGLGLDETIRLCELLGLELVDVVEGAQGRGPLGLLLSAQLHLAVSNPTPEPAGRRSRPILALV